MVYPTRGRARNTSPRSAVLARSFAASCLVAAIALGQGSPNGGEFQVNQYTPGRQENASVASDSQGRTIVVWQSASSGDPTDGVQARRFDSRGVSLGEQFQVNTLTTGSQAYPAVASAPSGAFVIAWSSDTNDPDGGGGVQVRRYDSAGTPLGPEFPVSVSTAYGQSGARVTMDAEGNFVVVWSSAGSLGTDSSWGSIQARRFDPNGLPLTGELQVNAYTTNDQRSASVAISPQGGFVVVWVSDGSSGGDTSQSSIQGRRFDSSGTPLGADFEVNTYTTGYQYGPSVATDPQGGFVVVWHGEGPNGTQTYDSIIHARRFDAQGSPLGDQFQVNTYTTNSQHRPSITVDSRGDFVVVWDSYGSTGDDDYYLSIQARRFDAAGNPRGDEFQVNTYTTYDQMSPVIAADAAGNFVVVWKSLGSYGGDTEFESIQAQRFDALFRDGFESADSSRWSDVLP